MRKLATACIYGLLLCISCETTSLAQIVLTLEDAISLAQKQSLGFHKAHNSYERSYWQFQNYRASLMPQLRLSANIPTFYRSINPITQPDGTIEFRRVSQANNSLGFNIVQNVAFTGGTLSAGTSLQRTDNFSGNKSSYFLSTPFRITYQQNSLLYNEFSWKKKIEPVLLEAAKKAYSEQMEDVALESVKLFFDSFEAMQALEISSNALASSDTLYTLLKDRFALGTVPATDLSQLELNSLTLKNELISNRLNQINADRMLKQVLGLSVSDSIVLQLPDMPESFSVNYQNALEFARANRRVLSELQISRMQADRELARAKGQNSIEMNILANLGTQQTAPKLADAYQNIQNQQYISFGLDIPIQDWGYRKSQIHLAKANRDLTEVNAKQEEHSFEHEIYMRVLQFNQQQQQMIFGTKAKQIAAERLNITQERYMLGKLGIAELNLAIQENILAKQKTISSIKSYWISYYDLRRLTLYDFIIKNPLSNSRR